MSPGGGYNRSKQQWIRNKGGYLFNQAAVAKVWRTRMLDYLNQEKLKFPKLPLQWIVDCRKVGRGLPALKYLSLYLYRGVLKDQSIISSNNGEVTFKHWKNTGERCTRTLPVLNFIWLVLQHVLPRRFRRLRCCGFLHSGGKRLLKRIQLLLLVILPAKDKAGKKPDVLCPHCQYTMTFLLISRRR
ncbi:MAG: transposase [Oceanospirillaceae bacterium]